MTADRAARIIRSAERIKAGRDQAGAAMHAIKEYISRWPGEDVLRELVADAMVAHCGMVAGAGEIVMELATERMTHAMPGMPPALRTADLELAQRVPMLPLHPIDDSQRELFARELQHIGDDTLREGGGE